MKRLTISAMAICLALALAVPAMALDADLSGEFRVRGFSHSAAGLDDDDASSSYYDARTRIKSVFKISDNISFTTQFDALEKVWGSAQHTIGTTTLAPGTTSASTSIDRDNYDDNINFEHAYATIKTPIGGLLIGRLIGSQWGPSGMGDSNSNGKDRILLFVPIENWTFVAYAEKYAEYDNGTTTSDEDLDKYTALVKYKGENFEAGYLQTNYRFKNFPAMRDFLTYKGTYQNYNTVAGNATTATATYDGAYGTLYTGLQDGTYGLFTAAQATTILEDASNGGNLTTDNNFGPGGMDATAAVLAGVPLPPAGGLTIAQLYQNQAVANATKAAALSNLGAGPTYVDANVYVMNPYLKLDFGPFSAFGEFLYGWGDGDVKAAGRNDMTIDVLAYHAEGKYSFGPGYVKAGYWFQSGDNNTTDDELEAVGYIEANEDLDIAFILTGSSEYARAGLENSLGGLGNFSGKAQSLDGRVGTLATAGAKLLYIGAGFSPMENLDLDFVYANAKADAPPGTKTFDPATNAVYGANWDDDVGSEYDFIATWTPMDNLEYKFVCAFLDAGDFWQMGNTAADVEDNLTIYNGLTISF